MACRRSHRTLGRLWSAGGRAPVPQGAGLPGDSVAVDFVGEHGFEEGCCRGSEGCVAYGGRESLTFNGIPGHALVEAAQVSVRSIPEWRSKYFPLAMRRGRTIAKVAMARRLPIRLYWMWRKGWEY